MKRPRVARSSRCLIAVVWAVLVAGFPTAASAGDDPMTPLERLERQQEALFEQVGPSVVFISAGTGFGSGFFVSGDGLILTNEHVVAGRATVKVVLSDGRSLEGQVVERANDSIDLALVKVDVADARPLALADRADLRVGAWVASVGHGRGGVWSFNTGMISNIYPDGAERPVFQTQIPLNPGNSGGPVVDRRGRVVGVVTAGVKDSNSINFAIRSDVALRSLSRLGGLCACVVVTLPEGVALFFDGRMVGTGPRVAVPTQPGKHEVFAVIHGTMKKETLRYPEQRAVRLE